MQGLYGGLLFVAGLSASASFVLGCFVGSKIQREVGYVIRTRAEKELLEQAKEREEIAYDRNRKAGADERITEGMNDAVEYLAKRAKTTSHPFGPPPPAPTDMPSPRSQDWAASLGTERARG